MVTMLDEIGLLERPPQGSTRRKRGGIVAAGLIVGLALGAFHFRTFIKVNKQITNVSTGGEINDSPTIRTGSEGTRTGNNEVSTSSSDFKDVFYQSHRDQMEKLGFLDGKNFIIWETRNKFAGLWKYFPNVYRKPNRDPKLREPNLKKYPYYFSSDICSITQVVSDELEAGTAIPHVTFIRLNENWGGFSQEIKNRTNNWETDLEGFWKKMGCSLDMIMAYLDHPYTRAVFTMQHQIIDHPKVHSLPLGIAFEMQTKRVRKHQKQLTGKAADRSQQLMVSHKDRPTRQQWTAKVVANFNNKVSNTYGGRGEEPAKRYYEELLRSKFILSPSGHGMDCYRNWESIYLGTIPVIETLNRKDGWFRTLSDLPVAWIDSYDNLTPEFLEKEYERILSKEYNYEKLTLQYWIHFIQSHLENVSIESLGPPPMIPKDAGKKGVPLMTDEQFAKYLNEEASPNTDGADNDGVDEIANDGDDFTAGLEETASERGGEETSNKGNDGTDAAPSLVPAVEEGKPDNPKETSAPTIPLPPGFEPLPRGSPEEAFYSYHREQVLSLVNVSSAMIWDTRSKVGAFKPLYDAVGNVYRIHKSRGNTDNPDLAASPFIFWGSICAASKAFKKHRSQPGAKAIPHVLFFRMNENWGGFSEAVPGKTAEWVTNLPKGWRKEGCTKESIFEYLDHPDTRAAITMQFQRYSHPKVHSVPLGLAQPKKLTPLLDRIRPSPPQNRPNLLMINSKSRVMRDAAVNKVIENFGGTIRNTYGKNTATASNRYYRELALSKFILSPGGLGFDCYRHWEAIIIGTIPVLESLNREDGWFRTLEDLPVAWIDKYENLTPEFLEAEYERIISQPKSYKYEKLTNHYWVDFIRSHVADVIEK